MDGSGDNKKALVEEDGELRIGFYHFIIGNIRGL